MDRYNPKLIFIYASCASGFDAAFLSINKYILKKERIPKQEGLVNLFAPTTVSYADQKEMERMLLLINVKVNYIPFYSSLEKIKKIPAAQASTSICKVFADEFMKTLWEDYEIPYSHTVMPIGIRNTDKWFRGIAKVLGKEKDMEEIIAREHEHIEPLVAQIRERLQGKRVFIGVPDWAAKLGIPTTHVLDGKRPTMGYDGLL